MKIKDFVVNEIIEAPLVVVSATARETRAKKPYLTLELFDGTDRINGNYWDWSTGNIPAVNAILDVKAQVTEWQGIKQLNIKSLKTNTTKVLADFVPTSTVDISKVYKDAYELVSTVKDDFLRNLTLAILDELRELWLTVPGAKGVHHAYVGGTLAHSYSVALIAGAMAASIPEANTELCVVGAMLHDLGKLFTYNTEGVTIGMTDDGQLYDHIFMGAEFVGNFAEAHFNCEDYATMKKLQLLRHIILAHHGKLEYGSPVTPMCLEAHIVNLADMLDSIAEQIRAAAKNIPDNIKWTECIYTVNNRQQLTPNYVNTIMSYQEEETVG